jgi:hypothetical protein
MLNRLSTVLVAISGTFVLISGLVIALLLDLGPNAADYRLFGWILVVIGLIGILSKPLLEQLRRQYPRRPPDQRRP